MEKSPIGTFHVPSDSTTRPGQRNRSAPRAGLSETVEVSLTFDDNRLASLVFGQYDQNVAHIERRLEVTATALGNHLVVKGAPDAAEKARRREAFDAREPYRFVPHAKRDTNRGTQRFRGPAVDGHPFKVRCPNTPASMRMPHTIPTTTCTPGEPCGCGKTITIHDSELERDRQHHP